MSTSATLSVDRIKQAIKIAEQIAALEKELAKIDPKSASAKAPGRPKGSAKRGKRAAKR
jgi:hypothetical protein